MLTLDESDRDQLLRKICDTVSAHLFSGLKKDESAASYRQRSELCGVIMGRLFAVLYSPKIDSQLLMNIRSLEERFSKAMADNASELVSPGGALQELWRREREEPQ